MTEPMRVLHVVGSLGIGGIQSYVMELYRHIDKTRIQFDFVVNIKAEISYADEIIKLGGKIFYIDGDAFEKKEWGQYIRFWKRFYKEHSEYRIVHGHLRSTALIYLREAKRYGLFTIAHSHATSNGYGKTAKLKDFMQWPVRYIADYCMGCSKQANEWMFGKKRANSDSCTVLYNGIDANKFKYSKNMRQEKRIELNIPDNSFVIGCVGRLVEQKNQGVLIEAMAGIAKKESNTFLLIIGDGPMRDQLQNRIEKLHISEGKVRILGSRTDVNELLSALDLFALPSKDEGLGIAAIEAQANGLPVLISQAVPNEVCITDHVYKVENNDAESWEKEILSRKYHIDQHKDESLIGSQYDIQRVSDQLTDFYIAHSA